MMPHKIFLDEFLILDFNFFNDLLTCCGESVIYYNSLVRQSNSIILGGLI